MLRLQKYLAECGVASRRASEKLIEAGRVSVNGETATVGSQVDPENDEIRFDGKPIGQDEKVYIVLNKPEGTVTTARDTHGRKTVLHWVKGVRARVFPVGRLDMDVEGVLLLTNDGDLAHRLLHPAYEIAKIYLAWVKGRMQPETVEKLARGIMLEDGMTAPAQAVILNASPHSTRLQLTLHEGRKREVKRMCAAIGHPVRSLHRVAFGNVRARGLRPGEWRYLSEQEVRQLRKMTKL